MRYNGSYNPILQTSKQMQPYFDKGKNKAKHKKWVYNENGAKVKVKQENK